MEARQRLESALDQAAAAITEGRDAVQGLRSSAFETNDLANGIIAIGEELTSDAAAPILPPSPWRWKVAPRQLNPVVRDEAYRIAGEALRNAFRHAQARQITVEILIRQAAAPLARSAMTERVSTRRFYAVSPPDTSGYPACASGPKSSAGDLEVWSKLDSGTQVELSIPGSIAYDVRTRKSVDNRVRSAAHVDREAMSS